VKTLPPNDVLSWRGRKVDVREPDEFARERLPGFECVPLGQLAARAREWDRTASVLVICKSGMRASQGATQLETLGFEQVAMIGGGLQACRSAGVPVIAGNAPLPIIRQVLITASLFLLTSLVLALFQPALIGLAWFVAIMLGVAGLTGWCPVALILARMPWNRTGATCAVAPEKPLR
jgi:rhodanese-related sulfurtransferase